MKRKKTYDVLPSVEECKARPEMWAVRINNLDIVARGYEKALEETLKLKRQAFALAAGG